jgi:hypothetical protein
VKKESDLWCAICSYCITTWKSAGLAVIPTGEIDFIRKFLLVVRTDDQYCRQVVPDWWRWPVDFWNCELDIYIQIDGHVHWYGMHDRTSREVQKHDMDFNKAAYMHNARLVRVHTADICNTQQLVAAIDAAKAGCRIVLTPSYATQIISPDGIAVEYTVALQQTLGVSGCNVDSAGNIIFP